MHDTAKPAMCNHNLAHQVLRTPQAIWSEQLCSMFVLTCFCLHGMKEMSPRPLLSTMQARLLLLEVSPRQLLSPVLEKLEPTQSIPEIEMFAVGWPASAVFLGYGARESICWVTHVSLLTKCEITGISFQIF